MNAPTHIHTHEYENMTFWADVISSVSMICQFIAVSAEVIQLGRSLCITSRQVQLNRN